jgi:hypothetical protein
MMESTVFAGVAILQQLLLLLAWILWSFAMNGKHVNASSFM